MPFAACQSGFQAVNRTLPPADVVVREPVLRPAPRLGEDARRFAARAVVEYGDENAARLIESRANYEQVVRTYAGQ